MLKSYLFFAFSVIVFFSCSNPSQSDSIKLSDYDNQYKMLVRYDGDLYSVYSDGSQFEKIKDFSHGSQDFCVNEDFSKIACVSHADGIIYVMNIDGSEMTNVTSSLTTPDNLSPKFLPGEEAIVYNGDGSLFRINLDGSDNQKLTPDSIIISSYLTVTVVPGKIVFAGKVLGNAGNSARIYQMNSDGSQLQALTNAYLYADNPLFSADGSKIIYTASIEGNSEIMRMNSDGSGKINLTNSAQDESYATWSPDGSMILFERAEQSSKGYVHYLFVINADGSGMRQIYKKTEQNMFNYFFAVWSPDQTRLAYAGDAENTGVRDVLYIIDIETGTRLKVGPGTYDIIWIDN